MIVDWRQQHARCYAGDAEHAEFIKNQPWFGNDNEYSCLFELLFDQPGQRREYIEGCVKDAKPSWGYIYLVNLIKHGVFNTIFTTNFDDMANESCYLFSDNLRPIVCAHDSSIRTVRITSKRPKIIKLHGDFLFDDIKNTVRELESLEDNMRDKFKQYASEFGVIVVGYAGNDRSVMDAFSALLRTETNFPSGIYWCVRKGDRPSRQVDALRRFPKFHLVEIDGFDELFADLHENLKLDLQDEMASPYEALADRLNRLMDPSWLKSGHRTITRHMNQLAHKIGSTRRSAPVAETSAGGSDVGGGHSTDPVPLPYEFLAQVKRNQGNLAEARELLLLQVRHAPDKPAFHAALDLLEKDWDDAFSTAVWGPLEAWYKAAKRPDFSPTDFALKFIRVDRLDFAEKLLLLEGDDSVYNEINCAQIEVRRGSLSSRTRNRLEEIVADPADRTAQMGAAIVLGLRDLARTIIDELKASQDLSDRELKDWPIFQLLSDR